MDPALRVAKYWGELSMDDQAVVHDELPDLADALDELLNSVSA